MNKYIERAITSIINQSFQNFEIIIVNDNSKDETEKIIKKLKLDDNRIKLINHINSILLKL
jgi:glycosyltransferase involved in cell wall biosynthesis